MKNYLKALREDHDVKQLELANLLGISAAQYSRLENQLSTLSIDQAITLADYFNVSLDYLVGRAEPKDNYVLIRHDEYTQLVKDLNNACSILNKPK